MVSLKVDSFLQFTISSGNKLQSAMVAEKVFEGICGTNW